MGREDDGRMLDFGPGANLVPGADGFGPTHLLDTGADHKTLYVAASSSIYRITMKIPGVYPHIR